MSVTITFTDEQYKKFQDMAANVWNEDEHDEFYENSVTQGNADDTFSDGDTQGSGEVALMVLSGHVWADRTLTEGTYSPHSK